MGASVIWTIGHSTRPIEEFLDVLKTHRIEQLADVRLTPYSRRNPHFNTEALQVSLTAAGMVYQPMPNLGGRRKARPDSANLGWRNASFRGYADYMQTDQFSGALKELMAYGGKERTAIMCAEAVPWRCHRSLIADALISRGWEVRHILSRGEAPLHALTSFARLLDGQVIYPAQKADPPSRPERRPQIPADERTPLSAGPSHER
jgi:uncharacterized protein (DUF488 family)